MLVFVFINSPRFGQVPQGSQRFARRSLRFSDVYEGSLIVAVTGKGFAEVCSSLVRFAILCKGSLEGSLRVR